MANKVTFTMNNVPAGLDSMYVRVEEDALTAGVRNVLHSGVQSVTGNTIDINIGENGTVGNGAIISADNYTSGGAAFKSMTGYALIEAGDITSGYDNVVIVGASIIERSFGQDLTTPNAAATQIFKDAGSNVDVYGYGWSGTTASFIANKLQIAMDTFPSRTLFIVHGGGNDVSSNRPYSGLTQPDIDAVSADFQSLVDVAASRSNDCIVCNITFRPYANITSNEVFLDESLGSKPFNDTLLLPKVASVMGDTLNSDGNSYIDLYNWTRNNYKKLLSADGVHLSTLGELELPKFIAERSVYKINSSAAPAVITPRDGVTVAFGNQILSTDQINSITVAEFNAGLPISLAKDFASTETVTLNITSTSSGTVNSGGASIGGNIYLGDLNFDDATKSSIYLDAVDTATFTFTGLENSKDYIVSFVGSRTAADERVTRFTSGSNSVDIYTSPTPANDAQSMTVTSTASGEIAIVMSTAVGDFGYVGGIQLIRVN